MKKSRVFKMTFCAIMAAMATILSFFEVNLPFFNVALYGVPLVFTSIILGPDYGLLAGLVCGGIEQISKGLSIQTFVWIIAPLAWGLLSGLVYYGLKKCFDDEKKYKKIIYYALGVLVSIFVANLANSFALAMFGYVGGASDNIKTFLVFAISRMASIPVHVIVYVPLCYLIVERMKKIMFIEDENSES